MLAGSALEANHSRGFLLSTALAACYAITLLLLPILLGWMRGRARPSAGLASRSGVYNGWPTQNGSLGPMARSVKDLATVLQLALSWLA